MKLSRKDFPWIQIYISERPELRAGVCNDYHLAFPPAQQSNFLSMITRETLQNQPHSTPIVCGQCYLYYYGCANSQDRPSGRLYHVRCDITRSTHNILLNEEHQLTRWGLGRIFHPKDLDRSSRSNETSQFMTQDVKSRLKGGGRHGKCTIGGK